MMWYNNWMGFGFGPFFMVIFWVLIIFLVLRLLRGGNMDHGCCGHDNAQHGGGTHKEDEAISILKQRYAKGEINKDQFEDMKKNLEK